MPLTINYAQNGWFLVHSNPDERDEVYVFSNDGTEKDEVKCFRDLLSVVEQLYGPTTSRYSAHRIYIRIEPGDKHEDFKENE